ncbi:SDR family oxidoreductase [Lachnospiraceae bacterium NSJ-143]|nr:SDR family oxidoreductase [Lachnospiraceae bacterium NSJ-143]
MELKGKTVLITGSSRGIGKAIACAFAKEGCNLVLNASVSSEELVKTQEELKSMGYYSYSYLADVSDYRQCKEMFNTISTIYGNVDILVNNAGISYLGLFTDMKPDDWNRVIDVNLKSVLNCCHLSIPKMVNQKTGVIINISSIWGERGASCEAVYSATKGAVNSFTKAMAKELGPSGIRVNAISCGVIDTKMNQCFSSEERDVLTEEISLMRFGTPEEIAKIAVFLAGNDSSFINGQIITSDGCMF